MLRLSEEPGLEIQSAVVLYSCFLLVENAYPDSHLMFILLFVQIQLPSKQDVSFILLLFSSFRICVSDLYQSFKRIVHPKMEILFIYLPSCLMCMTFFCKTQKEII